MMNANKKILSVALAAAMSSFLAGCGGGGGGANGNSQVNDTISPGGTVSIAGGVTTAFTASGVAKTGPISSSTWTIKQTSGDKNLIAPVLSDASCAAMKTQYQSGVDYSAKSQCVTKVTLPSLTTAATWQLSNVVNSPSGAWTDTVTINGTPSQGTPNNALQIITDSTTTLSVNSGSTVNLSCTAKGGQFSTSSAPKVMWSFGNLSLNGQPYGLAPAEQKTTAPDGSVTDTLKIQAPAKLYDATSLVFTCVASDDFSTISKDFTVNFLPAPTTPFNVIGGQTLSGSSGMSVSVPVTIQDPTGVVTSANVYVRWSQLSGPSVISSGQYVYGTPLNFTAPVNTKSTPDTLAFLIEASATPFTANTVVPVSQKAQVTYLNYNAINGGISVNAGSPQSVKIGAAASLTGTVNTINGITVNNYSWAITSAPSGSTAVLSNATSLTAGLIPDVAGSYVITFTVNATDATGSAIVRTAQTTVYAN